MSKLFNDIFTTSFKG